MVRSFSGRTTLSYGVNVVLRDISMDANLLYGSGGRVVTVVVLTSDL